MKKIIHSKTMARYKDIVQVLQKESMKVDCLQVVGEEEYSPDPAARQHPGMNEIGYEALFVNNHAAMLLTDPISLAIVDANDAACTFYGYSRKQMQKMFISELNCMPEQLLRKDMKAALEKKWHRFFVQHKLADGTIRDVEIFRSKVTHHGQAFLHSIVTEITEKKEEEENLHKLYRATQQTASSIMITDTEGNIEFVNPYVQKLTGYSNEDMVGQHARIFQSGQTSTETYQELWQTITSGKTWQGRLLNRKKNGQLYWELATISPVRNDQGTITHFAALKEDITKQVRLEVLEQEVTLAKNMARFRQDFLATMSHEIRTPVTGIVGIAEILETTSLDDAQSDYLETLQQSTRQLQRIINQVLDFSRIEAGKMQLMPRPFSLRELEQNTGRLFASLSPHGLHFRTATDPNLPEVLEADGQRIEQVITNFLSNAIKFTHKGTITMTIRLEQQLEDDVIMVKVSVCDTGPGIPDSLQERLFKPFGQLHREGLPSTVGTGLGLSISKELAQLLGGSIGVSSSPGKGSLFWFTFRARACHKAVIPRQPVPQSSSLSYAALRVLLVEDVAVNQKVISLMLKSLGHQVQVASNGLEALEMYRHGAFDLILMDVQMPVMDGVTATRKLRERHLQLPPVVGLSANAFEGDREKYLEQGMDDYLTKPLRIDDFRRLTEKIGAVVEEV